MAIGTGLGLAISGGLGALGSYLGSEKQSDAIEEAAQSTEEWQKYLVALEEKKYDEAARFRNLAYKQANLMFQQAKTLTPMYTSETMKTYPSTMSLLRQDVLREPGTSQLFQQGVGNIAAGMAPYGVSPKGSAFQRMYTNLLGQDIENTRQARFQLAGMGTQPSMANVSPETGYPNMSAAGAAQSDYASLIGAGGAVQGGMYGSLGQTAMQMPMYYSLLNYMNKQPGGGGTASNAFNPLSGQGSGNMSFGTPTALTGIWG